MKTDLAPAILNISDANVAKNVLGDILKIAPDAFKEFVTELLLGISSIPDKIPTKVTKDGIELTFKKLFLDLMTVTYTFESQVTRFFDSQENADIAIEERSIHAGAWEQSKKYPVKAVITYDDHKQMSLKEWLELAKQGE